MRRRNYVRVDRSSRAARRKKLLIAAGISFAVYLVLSFVFGEMGLVKYFRMKAQHRALTEEIAQLKQDSARLMREVRSLKTDPAYIERIARDKLGLARKGEIVYYYDETDSKSETRNPE